VTIREQLEKEQNENQQLLFAAGTAKRRIAVLEAENAHLHAVALKLSDYVRALQRLNEAILPTVLPKQ
jgi:hypothetical protein